MPLIAQPAISCDVAGAGRHSAEKNNLYLANNRLRSSKTEKKMHHYLNDRNLVGMPTPREDAGASARRRWLVRDSGDGPSAAWHITKA